MRQIITLIAVLSFLIVNGQNWNQLGLDIDGEAGGDWFGKSVSMNASGNRVAIGATHNNGNGNDAGHVRIYDWSGTAWVQLGLDLDAEAPYDFFGYSVSMNTIGDRVAIGAPGNNGNGISAGHVRVYEWNGTAWLKLGSDIDGEKADDLFGVSVSMNTIGDRVAIGASHNDGNGNGAGHVRVYEWSGTSWVQLGFDIDGESHGDKSGWSVSMNDSGNRVAIGAPYNDGSRGHVRIYEWSGTSWVQLGFDIDGESANDRCGYSVSMNSVGDRVTIGAKDNDGNGTDAGHVRIYEWSSTAWVQLGLDIDGEAHGDFFGTSVSINNAGDKVAIGAYKNDGVNGNYSGHVRIYEWSGSIWVQLGLDIDGEASGDFCGNSVSMNAAGDRVAIGAYENDGNGINAGHVRIYDSNVNTKIEIKNTVNAIKIYPNPANDIIMIDNGNYGAMSNYSININNSLSQQVYSSHINAAQFQIPVSTLGSVGTYFIQILDGNNSVVETKQLILH